MQTFNQNYLTMRFNAKNRNDKQNGTKSRKTNFWQKTPLPSHNWFDSYIPPGFGTLLTFEIWHEISLFRNFCLLKLNPHCHYLFYLYFVVDIIIIHFFNFCDTAILPFLWCENCLCCEIYPAANKKNTSNFISTVSSG